MLRAHALRQLEPGGGRDREHVGASAPRCPRRDVGKYLSRPFASAYDGQRRGDLAPQRRRRGARSRATRAARGSDTDSAHRTRGRRRGRRRGSARARRARRRARRARRPDARPAAATAVRRAARASPAASAPGTAGRTCCAHVIARSSRRRRRAGAVAVDVVREARRRRPARSTSQPTTLRRRRRRACTVCGASGVGEPVDRAGAASASIGCAVVLRAVNSARKRSPSRTSGGEPGQHHQVLRRADRRRRRCRSGRARSRDRDDAEARERVVQRDLDRRAAVRVERRRAPSRAAACRRARA